MYAYAYCMYIYIFDMQYFYVQSFNTYGVHGSKGRMWICFGLFGYPIYNCIHQHVPTMNIYKCIYIYTHLYIYVYTCVYRLCRA